MLLIVTTALTWDCRNRALRTLAGEGPGFSVVTSSHKCQCFSMPPPLLAKNMMVTGKRTMREHHCSSRAVLPARSDTGVSLELILINHAAGSPGAKAAA